MRAPRVSAALGLLGHTFVILCDNCGWLVCVPPGRVRYVGSVAARRCDLKVAPLKVNPLKVDAMPTRHSALAAGLLVSLPILLSAASGSAQETWQRSGDSRYPPREDAYRPDAPTSDDPASRQPDRGAAYPGNRPSDAYSPRASASAPPPNDAYAPKVGSARAPVDDAYRPPRANDAYSPIPRNDAYSPPPRPGYAQAPGNDARGAYSGPSTPGYDQPYSAPRPAYGEPYTPPPQPYGDPPPYRGNGPPPDPAYGPPPGPRFEDEAADGSYSSREILEAGRNFFGSVSQGLASVVEHAFKKQGRPNGYILGEDAGGAFVAGLRYGEGMLYTKDAGTHRVYWQGPSIGWDAGAEGSKVMMLVYNLRDPEEIYQRFGGVDGSAYLVGGVGMTFQKSGPIIVAPIRSGVGLRLGANIGYLKYTRRPTWNPF